MSQSIGSDKKKTLKIPKEVPSNIVSLAVIQCGGPDSILEVDNEERSGRAWGLLARVDVIYWLLFQTARSKFKFTNYLLLSF